MLMLALPQGGSDGADNARDVFVLDQQVVTFRYRFQMEIVDPRIRGSFFPKMVPETICSSSKSFDGQFNKTCEIVTGVGLASMTLMPLSAAI
jgi:hypothetical protein